MSEQREPLILTQYRPSEFEMPDAMARQIAVDAGAAVRVTPGSVPGRWALTPWHHIGTLVVEDQPILIRPKIPPENVFALLEVGLPDKAWRRELFGYDQAGDLLPAAVSWFARLVETTLGRGLLRSYSQHEESLVSMRGRLDVRGLFRQPGLALPVPCRFEEFSADIAENRYLRAAIRRVLLVPGVPSEDQRRLRRELVRLDGVDDSGIRPEDFDRINLNRLNQHYEPALRLAQMMLKNLTLTDRSGSLAAASFLININDVFELFVAARLKRLLWDRLEVSSQTRQYLGQGRKVPMKSDLEFLSDGRTVYVGDTKYKLTDDATAKAADYYQLLAYCTALGLDEGVLIYCRNAGGESEGEVLVKNADHRLLTYGLDLSGSPDAIGAEIENLADWIWSRLGRRRSARVAELVS